MFVILISHRIRININLEGIFDDTGYTYVTPVLVQQLKNPEGF